MKLFYSAVLSIFMAVCLTASAQTPGSGPSNPAPKGTALAGIIECGEGYTSHELYDVKITLAEVLRGEEAWKRLKEAGETNKQAGPGFEYALARFKFEYHARGNPGTCVHPLSPDQFTAYSAGGEEYPNPAAIAPKPELRKGLKSGDIFEGWVVFLIPQQDKAPLISYSADAGGAVTHGGQWFLLK